jgi:DNA-binding NarL/FixJ family response regulator
MSEEARLRFAVVEGDPWYRTGLVNLVRSLPEAGSVAAYSCPDPLLAVADRASRRGDETPWDIALLDFGLPAATLRALRRLKETFPQIQVVALAGVDDPASVLEAIGAGVDGYILKEASPENLKGLLELAARGGPALSPSVTGLLLKLVRKQSVVAHRTEPYNGVRLGQRQQEVLRALAEGRSYREISTHLGVSVDTVRTHVRRIYAALEVHSAAQAVSQAASRGFL